MTLFPISHFFQLDGNSESEVKEDDDEITKSEREAGDVGTEIKTVAKKKQRKKKSHKRAKANQPKSSDNADDVRTPGRRWTTLPFYLLFLKNLTFQFEDEIDRSVHEVNKILGKASATGSASSKMSSSVGAKTSNVIRHILNIDQKHLNPDNEMKKIFGSRVVAAETRTQTRRGGPGGGRNRAQVRSSHVIVVPKNTWPNPGKTGTCLAKILIFHFL